VGDRVHGADQNIVKRALDISEIKKKKS